MGELEFRDKFKEKEKERERERAQAAAAASAASAAAASSSLDLMQQQRRQGQGQGQGRERAAVLDEADDYDALMAEVRDERFAARAQDRTKTPEEVAREEKERLERLEKARVARMRGEVDAEIRGEAAEGDGDGEESGGESEEEEGGGGAGLQLGELGRGWDASSSSSGSDSEGSDEEDGEDGSGSESSESHESESDSDDGSDDGSGSDDEDGSGSDDASSSSASAAEPPKKKGKTTQPPAAAATEAPGRSAGRGARAQAAVAKALAAAPASGINPEMPYVLECPTTLERYGEMVREYARAPQDVAAMVERIRRYHSLRTAGDGGGNRKARVHNFYDVLMRRLRVLGDHHHMGGAGDGGRQVEIDAVAEALRALTHEMPAVAAALWGRMLTGLQLRLEKALRDHELGQRGSCWPSLGACLLLRLCPQIWPPTDFRHPVATPALLLLGQALTQCPVTSAHDAERGLFLAALALECTEGAGRVMPEALAFLLAVLVAVAPAPAPGKGGAAGSSSVPLPTFAPPLVAALRTALAAAAAGAGEGEGEGDGPIVLGGGGGDEKEEEGEEEEEEERDGAIPPAQARRLLAVACRLLRRLASGASVTQCPAAPELLAPFFDALARIERAHPSSAPVREARAAAVAAASAGRAGRQPLVWRRKGQAAVASLAPRIIDNFVVRKDEGLDRDKARVKQLGRQVKRERKGAMRELRRDAAFLDAEKVRGERGREEERRRVVKENMAWLQEQQASINQQVKQTKGEALRGGGSGVKRGMLTR